MYEVKVTTNNHDRHFKYGYEVPKEVLERYDWLDEDQKHDNWICYKGHWSHVSDYLAVHNKFHNPNPPEWLQKWDGYRNDSMSDGTIIRLSDDNETYQIGWFVSVSDNGGE